MKEKHKKELQALQVSNIILTHSIIWSTDVHTSIIW